MKIHSRQAVLEIDSVDLLDVDSHVNSLGGRRRLLRRPARRSDPNHQRERDGPRNAPPIMRCASGSDSYDGAPENTTACQGFSPYRARSTSTVEARLGRNSNVTTVEGSPAAVPRQEAVQNPIRRSER